MIGLLLLFGIIGLLAYYLLGINSYWSKKGVPQKEVPLIFGDTFKTLFRYKSFGDLQKILYNEFKSKRYYGVFDLNAQILVVKDPDLIKQITVKDFDHFTDHRELVPTDQEPLWSKNLFNLRGDPWRHMRATLSPSFTSSKMKQMFHLMTEVGENFIKYFEKNPTECVDVDMKDVLTRYTNDIIGTVAFGIRCDSLKDKNNEFYMMGKEATNFNNVWKNLQFFLMIISTKLAKLFNARVFSERVSNFFINLIDETIKTREQKNIVRQDMLQLLMDSRKGKHHVDDVSVNETDTGFATVQEHIKPASGTNGESLTIVDIAAQALIFFLGGFESVSHLMNFLSYELATNPDVQQRLQEEIDDTFAECNGKITYEALMKMKYLDMVLSETLRKYPSFVVIDRVCNKPYTIEAQNPDEKTFQLVKNNIVWLPVYAIHHDEDIYPEPEKFDPERFNDDNKGNLNPYTYFPFGVGPRNCIGSRFALLEAKILIFRMLSKFELVPNANTEIPAVLMKGNFAVAPQKRIILTLKPRTVKS